MHTNGTVCIYVSAQRDTQDMHVCSMCVVYTYMYVCAYRIQFFYTKQPQWL